MTGSKAEKHGGKHDGGKPLNPLHTGCRKRRKELGKEGHSPKHTLSNANPSTRSKLPAAHLARNSRMDQSADEYSTTTAQSLSKSSTYEHWAHSGWGTLQI